MPPVPRPILAAFCGIWWIYFTVGIYIEENANPRQVWWLDVWNGGLGGNGVSAFGASVLAIVLTGEVLFMVFSLGAYLRQKEAAKKAAITAKEATKKAAKEAAEEGRKEGREEGREELRKELADWYENVRADLAAGRSPSAPPPANGNTPDDP